MTTLNAVVRGQTQQDFSDVAGDFQLPLAYMRLGMMHYAKLACE
jgi:hypothetical protein